MVKLGTKIQSENRKSVAQFYKEVTALKILSEKGANIPKILGASSEGSIPLFIAEEYIEGDTLDFLTRQHQSILNFRRLTNRIDNIVSCEEVVPFLLQILEILDVVHKCGILHRDLKPDSIKSIII